MNELSQYLVNQILLEETELHNFVVVYSGRFQPFHKGHYATYQNLCKKFGKDKVFIGTSNKTDNQKSPFNFKEKKIIMTKMFGIPSNKIVEIKNPYAPTEILKNFDETTTGYISVVGEKDEMRLGGKYFEKYKGKIEQGYKDRGYVYVAPSQSNPISGTNVRNWLSKGDDEQQKTGFLKAYPKFDEKIFKLITLKLSKLSEGMPGGVGVGLSFPNGTINGAPKPKDVKKTRNQIDAEDENLKEEIKLDVEIGDTILMGKFKNKKTVVKTIGKDEHGMPTINGKKVATFRILPKVNIFKEAASTAGGEDSQPDGGYLPKGKARVLGGDDGVNSSDEWFMRGGYTQTDFPKADAIYASDDENQLTFKIKSKNNARSLNKPTTYPFGFDDVDVTQEIEKIEKAEKRLKKFAKQKNSISELITDYSDLLDSLFESDGEDDKYVHIGYGKYKQKGKEKDQNSPTFTKDDSGKYIQSKNDVQPTQDKPTGQAIQGADMFKHDKSVKQPNEKSVEDWTDGKDGWEILDDDRAKVKNIRDYTDEEYQGETGEYFENDVTKNVAPNAFKDESDMIQKMKEAKPVYLSSEEMQNMGNTDVGEILSASEEGGSDSMKVRGKELADEYGKDWNRLEKGIAKGNAVPSPIALRDKKGNLHLVAGNTRLMSFTAYGKKLPVKVIDYDGEFNKGAEPSDGGADISKYGIKNLKRKISGWAEKEKAFFEKHQDNPKSAERRSWSEAIKDKTKGARNAIIHGFKHEAHLFKSAAKGVGNFVSGKDVSDEEKKALYDVGKKIVVAGLLGVATGGLSHGVLPFAHHLAVEFVPHIVAETLAVGVGKAAIFADVNEDERLLMLFSDKIADGLENMPIPDDVMSNAIDTYNQTKDVNENYYYDGTVDNYADWARTHKRKYDNKKANFKVKDSGQPDFEDDLEEIAVQTDVIPGGLSTDKSLNDFATKYNTTVDVIKQKIKDGAKVEMEHTSDIRFATEIAKDHIWEDLHYYIKIKKVEESIITEVKKESVVNYYKAICKDLNIKPITIKFGSVGHAGAATTYDTKTFVPEYITFDLSKVTDVERAILHEITHQILLVKQQNAYHNCNKSVAFKKVENKLIDRYFYSAQSAVLREAVKVEMAKTDMDSVEKYADSQMSPTDVDLGKETDHFFQRLNDPRNGKEISPAELTGLFKRLARNKKKFLEFLKQYKEFVVKDRVSNINIAFIKVADRLIAKTIMRKADFKSSTPVFTTESLLMEGGAYGHMNHPFDTEINLTFGQLKDIVNRALDGNLEFAREKTDGQALAISWIDGRLVAARNKSHLKNKGAGALDINGVADKFAGRGELTDAYNFAMKDLSNAIKSLSQAQKDKVFKNGSCFMNIEVIYPTSVNVIPYGQPLLVFHGTMEYDENGDAIGESAEAGRVLGGMLKQVNADVQSKYTLQGPPVLKLPKSQDLSSKKGKYLAMISKLQKEFGLGDTAGVADYHQAWWENFVNKKSPTTLDNATKMGLVKRWAFGDKGFRIDKNSIKDEKTLAWATKIDKEDHKGISKDNLMKFEDIFLGVGADVLEFTASVLTVNPDSALRDMKKRLEQTIKDVQASGDPKKIDKLKLELKRLNAIGGAKRIVPIEGIVFVYNGQTFKLTGAFASLNQLLGIFYA